MLKIAPLNTPTGATTYPMLSQETSIGAGEISATQTITVPLMKTFLESTSVALDLEQTITTTPPIPEEAYPAAPQASQLDYGQSARSLYPAPEETSTQIFPSNTQRIIFQGSLAFWRFSLVVLLSIFINTRAIMSAVDDEVNYCIRCGEKLEKEENKYEKEGLS